MLDNRTHNTSLESPLFGLSNELLHGSICLACASLRGAKNRKFVKVGHLWPQLFPNWGRNRKKCSNQVFINSSKMSIPRIGVDIIKIVVLGCPRSWYPQNTFCAPNPKRFEPIERISYQGEDLTRAVCVLNFIAIELC